jgi:amino acid transporter
VRSDVFDRRSFRMTAGWLSVVEMLVLGPAAAILVLGAIPSAFEVEWACVGATGSVRTAGDTYVAAFATLGTMGWLGVLVALIYAEIAGWQRLVAVLPLVWFAVLVAAALVAAAVIGPEPCPV